MLSRFCTGNGKDNELKGTKGAAHQVSTQQCVRAQEVHLEHLCKLMSLRLFIRPAPP